MPRKCAVLSILLLVLLGGFSFASATSTPAKIVTGVVSNVISALVKWLWSLKSNTKPAVPGRSMMKFENGYTVETVFDGSKHGIEPYSIGVSPGGELLVLDSENSNLYHISTPLSRYSRPKLIAGTLEGHSGHVDGKLREARLNHPKGITVDDRGNTYIADTMNMAIRKISDGGVVTTIAGGKWARGGGHIDGPSEDAKFSDDFDVVYIPSSCSLLVVDRGNQAIREIQLNDDDCNNESNGSFPLGIAVLVAAGLFGYVLALLQFRLQALFSSTNDSRTYNRSAPMAPYQKPPRLVRPPMIPDEDELEKPEEGFFGSMGRLVVNTASTAGDVVGGFFPGFKRKRHHYQYQQQYQHALKHFNAQPMQETLAIPDEYGPSSVETRAPMPKRSYQFSAKDTENNHHYKQNRGYYDGWDGVYHQNQQQHPHQQQQQHHHRQNTSNPKTYYEKSCETNEIVFGAVQEQDGRREAVVIKAVDYADPRYNHYNIRPRFNYVGYSNGY